MPQLLVVHHRPTDSLQRLTEAVVAGGEDPELGEVQVRAVAALEATASDVRAAAGIVLVTSANFGYMSGALKHFFDSTFLEIGGALDAGGGASGDAESAGGAVPYGLLVHGRYDVTGAVRSVQAIVGALPWRQGAEVVEVLGEVTDGDRDAAYELGATIGALTLG